MPSLLGRSASLLILALVACSPAVTSTSPSTQPNQVTPNTSLRLAQIGLPASMSPEASAYNHPVYGAMYDSMTWLDAKNNVIPMAATKWEALNPTTWRFTLRQDLTFTNGDMLTADDVEFTYNMIIKEKWPQVTQLNNLTGAKKVDTYTVDLMTSVPDASVLGGALFGWILPKEYFTAQGKEGFVSKPIGSGPYELVDFRTNDIAVFKKKTTEHPYRKVVATHLTFRSITEQTQMAAGLRTGDLDAVYGLLSPDVVEGIRKTDAKVDYRTISNISGLYSQPEAVRRNTPLTNKTVRLALNYAIDKDSLTKNLYGGFAEPTGQLSTPNSPGWDPNIKPYPYEPATAKKLLAEAGYPNGFALPIGIEFTPQTVNPNIATLVQSNLRDVGIEAPIASIELAAFLDKYYGRNGQVKGDIFLQSTGDTNGFMTQAQGLYTCNKPLHWWCNPEFDRNMQLANGEADVVKRGEFMRKAIRAFYDDVAHMQLLISSTYMITSPKLQGFVWENPNYYLFDKAYTAN